MTYQQAMEYIDEVYKLGTMLGLNRVELLMEELGNPQETMKTIHVAGTNGKGSTAAMLTNVLRQQGYRVGMYTSPHLQRYNERYLVNGVEISDEDFGTLMGEVKAACDKMVAKGLGQPTIFEVVTALGFLYFAKEQVDYLVLEVGMGGRSDATNVIHHPVLSVITSISLDHMEFLGDTLSKIAYEKGGIIKEGCPVVLYTQGQEVYDTICAIAEEKHSKLYFVEEEGIHPLHQDIRGTAFDIFNEYVSYCGLRIGLLGEYQLHNAATVLLAIHALRENGVEISEDAVRKGLSTTKWSGRMEVVEENPTVLLDGAHNIDGIHMLAESLKLYFADKDITLLVGILGDKEYEKMMDVLLPLAKKVVLTEPNNSRKWDVDTLTETISHYTAEIHREKDIAKAYDLAKSITAKDQVLCCAGSLYLIGELYKLARKQG